MLKHHSQDTDIMVKCRDAIGSNAEHLHDRVEIQNFTTLLSYDNSCKQTIFPVVQAHSQGGSREFGRTLLVV